MNEQDRQKIARENRIEILRAKTGLSSRDWSVVLGSIVVAIFVLGFIYAANNRSNVDPSLEPAAGDATATGGESPVGTSPQAARGPSPLETPGAHDIPDISPNPAD